MRHFDLVVVGTGSGNSVLDERFAGWDVALVERARFGGTCLNVGCIPTKMFVHTADVAATPGKAARLGVDETLDGVRWPDVRDRIFGRIDPIADAGEEYRIAHEDNRNVTVYRGDAVFTGHKQLTISPNDGGEPETITAERIVLAAGGRPVVPDIEGLAGLTYFTSDTVMRLDTLPRRMTIVGGGFVAAEFAHVFSSFGVEVTIVARSGAMLRAEDADVSARFTELAQQRWDVRLHSKVVRAEQIGAATRLHLEGPSGAEVVESDVLLFATGRRPNTDQLEVSATGLITHETGYLVVDEYQQTNVDGIWALGDISSPWTLKHVANHEQRVVQHNLLHPDEPVASDHRFVPHAVFSSPQIASVGLTERHAEDRGLDFVVSTHDYADIAYGWAMEDTTGFAKLIADPDTGQLLGAHILGPQASTLIQPLIQAMSFGLDARRMARGQYWIHPALPELVENALLKLPLK
ncbi:mycothione reductase [Phytoactinopolyspora endophytica]|uniref:mycothione reductase n=1 Tax=Phytoactinopolyspora endophytica TaxID=1642495 RepID=UPI00101E1E6D|nr:mycothione reductase [Phytoactinopolyspora endophytica]